MIQLFFNYYFILKYDLFVTDTKQHTSYINYAYINYDYKEHIVRLLPEDIGM